MSGNKKKIFGDYQTPIDFCKNICDYIKNIIPFYPDIIIEPTCGIGNFLFSASECFHESKLIGIEINNEYLQKVHELLRNKNFVLENKNIFDFSASKFRKKNVLILGNPPWVTNSYLAKTSANNTLQKRNLKNLRGIDAITGSANFDICESIILKLIDDLKYNNTFVALLCKTSVARNVYKEIVKRNIPFDIARIVKFDSKKVWNVSVDAGLFILNLSTNTTAKTNLEIFNIDSNALLGTFHLNSKGEFISSSRNEKLNLDGVCCFEWRQGLKHDCANIMELKLMDNSFFNNIGDKVEIEDSLIYPLFKSSSFKEPILVSSKKYVIVTQKRVNEDTSIIKLSTPRTWNYLISKENFFKNRKSVVYKKSPPFSIFGIGEYSFAKYKVGISGFYKKPYFSLITTPKPGMLDDTCYFLAFDTYNDAYVCMLLLNSDAVKNFLEDISFKDSKRPFSKKVLERLDFQKILKYISFEELQRVEVSLKIPKFINIFMYDSFKSLTEKHQLLLQF